MLHASVALGSGRVETLCLTAMAIHRMLFNTHNPVVVAELEHGVCGMDTTVDHAALLPPFIWKCSDSGLVLIARDHSTAHRTFSSTLTVI
jgi:hypothetical protein